MKAQDFRSSIRMLAERADSVPAGWRCAYEVALIAFNAVDCPRRHDIVLGGPFVNDISLTISADRNDCVVSGIARSLSIRTEQTCEKCGKVGRLRTIRSRGVAVLCPTCAAPRILSVELTHLLRDVGHAGGTQSPRNWSYDEVPVQVRPVIPREAWRCDRPTGSGSRDTTFVSDAALRCLKPRFDLLQGKLAAFLDSGKSS